MAKNINKRVFDEASKLKLEIFGESFKEWLPVFIYDKFFTDYLKTYNIEFNENMLLVYEKFKLVYK